MPPEHRKVIVASGLGAMFEWYDFYLYGVLAPVLAVHFFTAPGEQGALVATLLAFAAGFAVRPLGALFFGRLGDLIGRKYTFLMTLLLMGSATFAIGVLPGQETIGIAAPAALVILRLLQGLAIGGEYGGVATYVAEHAPRGRRGFYTGWVQTTASLGLLCALLAIVGLRSALGEAAFLAWGWRLPFLLSALLLAVGIWVRLSLKESPIFWELKRSGGASRSPLREAFGNWPNVRRGLAALFGLVAAQAVVWYTGQFEAFYFMTLQLKVDATTASLFLVAALALGAPLFVVFGALSDRVGRKPIILAGALLAALAYLPLFEALTEAANPALAKARQQVAVTLTADPAACGWQFELPGLVREVTTCGLAKRWLAERAVRYSIAAGPGPTAVGVGEERIEVAGDDEATRRRLDAALDAAGYPTHADPARIDRGRVVGILFLLVVFVTMVYGPIAAMLVEMFATRVRCSSVSLPYHIGNGWFGGLLPSAILAIGVQTGNVYAGLWVPIAVAMVGSVIGAFFVRETKDVDLRAVES
ncbi:MAG: MFS transporter [Burkholderiales bacterium]|nr:MFS transporter [Burkholderiales bacterium]